MLDAEVVLVLLVPYSVETRSIFFYSPYVIVVNDPTKFFEIFMRDHKIYVLGVPALVTSMNGHLMTEILVQRYACAPEINNAGLFTLSKYGPNTNNAVRMV